MMQCKAVFPKITSTNLCKSIHDINYSTSICPFESGKCRKGKNYKNWNISRTTRAFYITFFIAFKGLSFGEKTKFW